MSRGYDDDCDGDSNFCYLWESIVRRAMEGKRGQAVLREIESALVALPNKRLIREAFSDCGDVCALGALALKRGIPVEKLESVSRNCEGEYSTAYADAAKSMLGITEAVARTVQHANDEGPYSPRLNDEWKAGETPEDRYTRVLAWVRSKIKAGA